jgi:hypothetical protein
MYLTRKGQNCRPGRTDDIRTGQELKKDINWPRPTGDLPNKVICAITVGQCEFEEKITDTLDMRSKDVMASVRAQAHDLHEALNSDLQVT